MYIYKVLGARLREGNGSPLQYSCLENPMEEPGGLQFMGSQRDTTERLHFHFHALEKEMATHSSVLAWRIPGTGEPGGLPSIGLQSRTRLKRFSSSSSSSLRRMRYSKARFSEM